MHCIFEKQFERAVELSKLNPLALEEDTFRHGKPIEYVIKSGYTDLADQLIGVLDQHKNESNTEDL
jgi:hypothetical protein